MRRASDPAADGQWEELSPRIERLAQGYAQGLTQRQAATYAGVSPRTARRWQHDPAFQARRRMLADQNYEALNDQILGATGAAFDTVREVLDDPNPRVRTEAARLILGQAQAAHVNRDLAGRIERLEAQLAHESALNEEQGT